MHIIKRQKGRHVPAATFMRALRRNNCIFRYLWYFSRLIWRLCFRRSLSSTEYRYLLCLGTQIIPGINIHWKTVCVGSCFLRSLALLLPNARKDTRTRTGLAKDYSQPVFYLSYVKDVCKEFGGKSNNSPIGGEDVWIGRWRAREHMPHRIMSCVPSRASVVMIVWWSCGE